MEIKDLLDRLCGLEKDATPGPWKVVSGPPGQVPVPKPIDGKCAGAHYAAEATVYSDYRHDFPGYPRSVAIHATCDERDAKLICELRNSWSEIAAHIEELERKNATLHHDLDAVHYGYKRTIDAQMIRIEELESQLEKARELADELKAVNNMADSDFRWLQKLHALLVER